MAKQEVGRQQQSTRRESCGNCGNYGKLSIPLRSIPSFPQFPQFPQLRLLAISLRSKTEKPVSSAVYPALVARRRSKVSAVNREGSLSKCETARARRTIFLTAPFIELLTKFYERGMSRKNFALAGSLLSLQPAPIVHPKIQNASSDVAQSRQRRSSLVALLGDVTLAAEAVR